MIFWLSASKKMDSKNYFIGRKEEIELIDVALKFDGTIKTKESQLIIVDGRRRLLAILRKHYTNPVLFI